MNSIDLLRARSLGSLLFFTRLFYKERTRREFVVSQPVSRESHHISVCKELTAAFRLEGNRFIINIPPGHGKSEMCIHFVAWALAHYPDSNFLYISYSHDVAAKHTYTIKSIIQLPLYKELFGVKLRSDSQARDRFMTEEGGIVRAFGSGGPVTGQDAGLPILDRFSGCVLMDDMHKPDEVHSDTMRESVIDNYKNTIKYRARSSAVPFIFIGQQLHEADLSNFLIDKKDGYEWRKTILPSLDENENPLSPLVFPLEMLLIEREVNPYAFAAQHQQCPQPAGGGIFKPEWFVHLDEDPDIISSFITIDTAETDKSYNDATVFSFWGIYLLKEEGISINKFSLHWIDCQQIRVEPKDLEQEFRQFYSKCLQYKIQPQLAAIEKKSSGTTLLSVLSEFRGINILNIERTRASGSKVSRYLEIQPYVASKLISFNKRSIHSEMCITQARKITANNTHAHDDIIDTLYDGIKLGLIDKYFSSMIDSQQQVPLPLNIKQRQLTALRKNAYVRRL